MILNINIQIDTSNSAFEEDNEVETIITKHLKENYLLPSLNKRSSSFFNKKSLRDSNGNTVGTFTTYLYPRITSL